MDNNNTRSTRSTEKARIQAIVAANIAAAAAAASNATRPTTTAASSSGIQPTAEVASSSSNNALTATSSSSSNAPTTTTASSRNKPKTPTKTPTKPSPSKTPTKASRSKTTPGSTGEEPPRYNPDISPDTEENINVYVPRTPTIRLRVSRGKNVEQTTTTSPSGPIDDENRAPAQNNTELTPRRPTIRVHIPENTTNRTSAPEQALENMASLRLHNGPEAPAPERAVQPGPSSSQSGAAPVQATEVRQEHPDYPDVPKEVPVDEDGVRKSTPLFLVSMLDVYLTFILVHSYRILLKSPRQGSDLGSKEVDRDNFFTVGKRNSGDNDHRPRAGGRIEDKAVVMNFTPCNHEGT
jgi:hypothetical protein